MGRPRFDRGPLASSMRGRNDEASDPRVRGDDAGVERLLAAASLPG